MATSWQPGNLIRAFGRMLGDYLGARWRRRSARVADPDTLIEFLATRSSHVAQTSLYGYLKARAGTRFPELFADDDFLRSINIAKWQIWIACVSDLSVYCGGLIAHRSHEKVARVGHVVGVAVESILERTGVPADAGPEFAHEAMRLRTRVHACHWNSVTDDDAPFSESPAALVRWAPVVEEFKQLDEEIVRNSVRFRWQDVRREFRRLLDAHALMAVAGQPTADSRSQFDRT